MKVTDLPNIEFVDANKEVVEAKLLALYTATTGRSLSRADPIRLFILVIANAVILLLNAINESAKQNLLAYATGTNLDHIGIALGVERLPSSKAVTTMEIQLSAVRDGNVIIPIGTRFTAGDNVVFSTVENTLVPAGKTSVTVKAECETFGEVGNGYQIGVIKTLVDPLPFVASVRNTTVTEGGANIESDDHFRERIHEAPESFSCAGSEGAYQFHVKKASPLIESVTVVSPGDGKVQIYPILQGGKLPDEELKSKILESVGHKYVRPLTDKVSVETPLFKDYNVNMTYYISKEDASRAVTIQRDVELAVNEYITWQTSTVGRDINPSELIHRVMKAGAKRVEVTTPTFTKLKNGVEADGYKVELARLGTKTVNYGGYENE